MTAVAGALAAAVLLPESGRAQQQVAVFACAGNPARQLHVRASIGRCRAGEVVTNWYRQAGPQQGTRLEYTQTADGSTYVRYLTGTARAGSASGGFVVVATYAQPHAFARVSAVAKRAGLAVTRLREGAIAVRKPGRPQNLYVVYPGRDYQVEVYGPSRATTDRLVFGDRLRPVR